MTVQTMRRADRFLGVPLCWLFGVLLPRSGNVIHRAPQNVLVIKFFGLGSILLSTSALSLLKSSVPGVRIIYLSFESNRELLERIPMIDEIVTIRGSSIPAFLHDTWNAIVRIRKVRPDVVLDLEFFSKFSTLLSVLSGAPRRVGFSLPAFWRSALVTDQVPLTKSRHVVEAFCDQVRVVACSSAPAPHVASPEINDSDSGQLKSIIGELMEPYIVVNINSGSTFFERRWPAERFSALVSRLSRNGSVRMFFTGSIDEKEYVQAMIDISGTAEISKNLAGRLTIPQLCALLRSSELLISNDSAPLHIASAYGIPTVSLFGPETPKFYGPVDSNGEVIYKGIECSPCMNIYAAKTFWCPYNARCMREIGVDEVEAAVLRILTPVTRV
ncbi:MAG TPA: glycosyltransferase family 9 protein [Bacteroidota bacterium]|nr:glycosyltransferase family 9 protein [Bacteroidota bacterium]